MAKNKIIVDLKGDEKLKQKIKLKKEEADKLTKRAIEKTVITMADEAKEMIRTHGAVDSGRLMNSISYATSWGLSISGKDKVKQPKSLHPTAAMGSNVKYAPYVEFNTRPHMPPVSALVDWARRHGFDSPWPVAMAIKKKGTKGRPFIYPAYFSHEKDVDNNLKKEFRKL